MTTIDELHRRRKEIIEMASVIEGLMTPQQLAIHPIAKVAHILLCDLCEMMSDHLADEHKGLYPNLLTHGDTSVKNMAWGLINNDKLLKPEFNRYKRKWLRDCEFQFTEEQLMVRDAARQYLAVRSQLPPRFTRFEPDPCDGPSGSLGGELA